MRAALESRSVLGYYFGMHLQDVVQVWEIWRAFSEVTESFKKPSDCPLTITEDDVAIIEKHIILLFDRASLNTHVNSARGQLLTKKGRPVDGLSPTKDALIQHTFRATYQSG